MTTVKVKFRASTVPGALGSLYFQVRYRRAMRQFHSGYYVDAADWDERESRVLVPASPYQRMRTLTMLHDHLRQDRQRLLRIADKLDEQGGGHTVDDVVARFREEVRMQPFREFMLRVISQLEALGQVRTAETYTSALRSFMSYCGTMEIRLDDFSVDLMLDYEAYLKRRGLTLNTVSFYMRILRATYNRAVNRKLTVQCNPFQTVYTGVERTQKRAVSLKVIRQLKALNLSDRPSLEFSRDMFMFSFYTRGMSFVDMTYLRRQNLKGGVLVYRRRKTGQCLYVKWEPCMQEIVEKYAPLSTDYLLPIIRRKDRERQQYRNAQHMVNLQLKAISKMMGLPVGLTMYVARHSWASIAHSKNVPVSVISEGMGHNSENTTKIYLASLDHSVIDKANELILRSL